MEKEKDTFVYRVNESRIGDSANSGPLMTPSNGLLEISKRLSIVVEKNTTS